MGKLHQQSILEQIQRTSMKWGEGNGTPLQYSCLENPMDGGAWWAAVHGVVKSRTRLSDFTFNFHFYALEKEMATHSSVLAWRIPGTGEPGGLPSLGRTESDTTEWLQFHFSLSCVGEGNGNPLQCSCLENPRDGGAWWAAVSGSHRVGHDWREIAAGAAVYKDVASQWMRWEGIGRFWVEDFYALTGCSVN